LCVAIELVLVEWWLFMIAAMEDQILLFEDKI
jgi:hypothetical protein